MEGHNLAAFVTWPNPPLPWFRSGVVLRVVYCNSHMAPVSVSSLTLPISCAIGSFMFGFDLEMGLLANGKTPICHVLRVGFGLKKEFTTGQAEVPIERAKRLSPFYEFRKGG